MASNYNDILGLFQGDLVIKAAIELGMSDMRKNPWLIEDIFISLLNNPYLKRKYGAKEIARAREFLMNNKIPVYLAHRVDKQEFPCITITVGESTEDTSLSTFADQSIVIDEYTPDEIGKTIQYIMSPFNPVSYDKLQGVIEVPADDEQFKFVSKGMVVVNPRTGAGYTIEDILPGNKIKIAPNSKLSKKIAVVPNFRIFRARRERAISQETYNIGLHVSGDPSTLIFLHGFVKYILYRYREGLLEANNFQLSRIKSTDLIKNNNFGQENIYSRWIILSGQVEESWVKTPERIIESIVLEDPDAANGLTQGIKMLSNEDSTDVQTEEDLWITVKDNNSNL